MYRVFPKAHNKLVLRVPVSGHSLHNPCSLPVHLLSMLQVPKEATNLEVLSVHATKPTICDLDVLSCLCSLRRLQISGLLGPAEGPTRVAIGWAAPWLAELDITTATRAGPGSGSGGSSRRARRSGDIEEYGTALHMLMGMPVGVGFGRR